MSSDNKERMLFHLGHYNILAKQICHSFDVSIAYNEATEDARDRLITNLCERFKLDNPNFDEAKFRSACGGDYV